MDTKITLEKTILETIPFSRELIEWCNSHPEFLKSLKNIYSDRFISLGAIATSYSPNYPMDEVIGVYTYDYKIKNPIFKQDFIVNIEKRYLEFVLYTRNTNSSRYVKDINEFFATYGKGGYYTNSHHITLDELPLEIQERGKRTILLAEKLKSGKYQPASQEHIEKSYWEIMAEKK